MAQHEHFMERCLFLAKQGMGHVAPNPMVGSVLVYDDKIAGEGFHRKYGEPHAEVNCINDARLRFRGSDDEFKSFLRNCTIYVSLEPCAHFGKTPPCADLIIRSQIPRVVVGCRDPFPLVDGKGIEKLKAADTEVISGVLEEACKDLNRRFFTFHQLKRPFILLKWAQSADGFISGAKNERTFISNPTTNRLVHRWRSEEAAILVGATTALKDNPSLNTRLWKGKDPLRMVIDPFLRLPPDLKLFTDGFPTIIFNGIKTVTDRHLKYIKADNIGEILAAILELNVQSVMIEGGRRTLQSLIDAGLWDEARVITASDLYLEDGTPAPLLSGARHYPTMHFANDRIDFLRNKSVL